VEGHLRWGLIPHFCEKRPEFAPIHARAETIAENDGLATPTAGGAASFP
jgi:putative SOS response-associated peptidase YedK